MNRRAKILIAHRQDREKESLIRPGLRETTAIMRALRAALIARMMRGSAPAGAIAEAMRRLLPALVDAGVAAHLAGNLRSLAIARLAKPHAVPTGVRAFGVYQNTLDQLSARAGASDEELAAIHAAYSKTATAVLAKLGPAMERKVQGILLDIREQGMIRKDAIDYFGAQLDATGISLKPNVVETIYRTQTAIAYNAGRLEVDQSPEIGPILWGYEYATVGDDRVRPNHAAMDGIRLPKDHPFWKTSMPPSGYNCRCTVIEIFEEEPEVQPRAKEIDGIKVEPVPDQGFAFSPETIGREIAALRPRVPEPIIITPSVTKAQAEPEPARPARLTAKERASRDRDIAADFQSGTTVPELATKYGLRPSQVKAILAKIEVPAIKTEKIPASSPVKHKPFAGGAAEIGEALARYRGGDDAIAAVKSIGKRSIELTSSLKTASDRADSLQAEWFKEFNAPSPDNAMVAELEGLLDKATADRDEISAKIKGIAGSIREEIHAAIAVEDSAKLEAADVDLREFSEGSQSQIKSAFSFVNSVVRRGTVSADSQGEGHPRIIKTPLQARAQYQSWDQTIIASDDSDAKIISHELGHHLEKSIPGANAAARAFLDMRCKGPVLKINQECPGSGYGNEEVSRDDKFGALFPERRHALYVAKAYESGETEVISMGIQELWRDPANFAEKDPEYFKFIVGVIRGDI